MVMVDEANVATFQFTHPGRGATDSLIPADSSGWFQFTHPGRGATVSFASRNRRLVFQFTHPGRGATKPVRGSIG